MFSSRDAFYVLLAVGCWPSAKGLGEIFNFFRGGPVIFPICNAFVP